VLRDSLGAEALPLNSSRSAVFEQCFDFFHATAVEITGDRVLEAACGDRELESVLMAGELLEAVNQARSEAISRTDAVHDVGDVVGAANDEFVSIVQAR
jgi:hypothetical protein